MKTGRTGAIFSNNSPSSRGVTVFAAAIAVGQGRTRPEGWATNSDVAHTQVPEVASGGQGRKTGSAHHEDSAEAFCSRTGEA